MPKVIQTKHPLAIRWFHWINFPVLSIMVWSGLLIYWAQEPTFTLFGRPILPDRFFTVLNLNGRLAEGMGWHFLFMWVFAINGILYVLYLALSGEWRALVPQRGSLRSAIHTVLHDLRLRHEPPAQGKFNGAQQFAYTSIVLMGGLAVLSGIAIYKPVQASGITRFLGGYEFARLIHFLLMLGFLGFFCIHVGQVVKAGWNNFRAMVTGYELAEDANGETPKRRSA